MSAPAPTSRNASPTVPLPAGLERAFEITLYLMVLTGFGTLASTGALDIATLLLVSCALYFVDTWSQRGASG